MVERNQLFAPWGKTQLVTVLVAFLSAAGFALGRYTVLTVALASYGIILIESRLYVGRLFHDFPGAAMLGRLVRSAVFFLPLPILGLPIFKSFAWGIPCGMAYGLLLILLRLPEVRFNLSCELLSILPPISRGYKARDTFHLIAGAIGQEYFYRGVILYLLSIYIGAWAIIVSAMLFLVEHLMHCNASDSFDRRDYLYHIALSLGLGVVFYYSESLVGCAMGHVVYQVSSIIQTWRRKTH